MTTTPTRITAALGAGGGGGGAVVRQTFGAVAVRPATLSIFGRIEAASVESRTLAGEAVAWGGPVDAEHPQGRNVGMTNAGPLRVARRGQVVDDRVAAGLRWPTDVSRVKLTEDHNRAVIRGHALALDESDANLRATIKASSDADGDRAIAETVDHKRDGFSIDVVNGQVVAAGDGGAPWLVSGDLVAIGHVGLPAFYEGSRIDRVAAIAHPSQEGTTRMTAEQRARLKELLAKQNLTTEETTELSGLTTMAAQEAANVDPAAAPAPAPAAPAPAPAAPQAVAASLPTVPTGGVSGPPATTRPQGGALDTFVRNVYDLLIARRDGRELHSIVAALSDITNSSIPNSNINMPAWSGELWSGVAFEPEFVPLLNSGDLTNYEGKGWKFTTKPAMADYAGNKAAIPSGSVATAASTYTAARQAVGHDIDRKFYDFPDEAFIRSYVEAVRESWFVNMDAKVEAWLIANATASGVTIPYSADIASNVLKAVGKGRRIVKRAKLGNASFAVVADADYDSLMDIASDDLPAFLSLFGVEPDKFVDSSSLAAGTVIVGTKMAATFRTLPGSPIRVNAQAIANGGVDEAFFGYWAIESHAATGVQSVAIDETP